MGREERTRGQGIVAKADQRDVLREEIESCDVDLLNRGVAPLPRTWPRLAAELGRR